MVQGRSQFCRAPSQSHEDSSLFDLAVVRIDGPTRTSDGLLISGPIPTSCLSNGGGSKRPASPQEQSTPHEQSALQ